MPRVTDNDKDEITVSLDGKELRGWSYASDDERRQKMLQAREYVEGWCDGRDAAAPYSTEECPLCKLKASSMLHRFCTRGECPVR